MGLKNMDMGPTLRMLRTLSESPTDSAELSQANPANSAFLATRPALAAVAADSAAAFAQSPIAKQYREVSSSALLLLHAILFQIVGLRSMAFEIVCYTVCYSMACFGSTRAQDLLCRYGEFLLHNLGRVLD